jgi:hypothetical protein
VEINTLMQHVGAGYPERYTENYWNDLISRPRKGSGDGLAYAIVQELFETFDPEADTHEQFTLAIRMVGRMRDDCSGVIARLEWAMRYHQKCKQYVFMEINPPDEEWR